MGFLSKNLAFVIGGVSAVALALLGLFCFNQSLEISNLKDKNKELLEQNKQLATDKAILKVNISNCDAALASQNEAILAAQVKVDPKPSRERERIKKIYIKDNSCEAELAAYKELFK